MDFKKSMKHLKKLEDEQRSGSLEAKAIYIGRCEL